jgi:hypothetical protein
VFADADLESLVPVSGPRAYALTITSGLLATTDGGRHWRPAMTTQQESRLSGYLGVLDVLNPETAWVGLWDTTTIGMGLFHTTDGGSSWLVPPVAVPPVPPQPPLPTCRDAQLRISFTGSQGGTGNLFSTFRMTDIANAACQLMSPLIVELFDASGTTRRKVVLGSFSPIALTPQALVPTNPLAPSDAGVATVTLGWFNLPDAILSLGATGDTCPQPLFTATLAEFSFAGQPPVFVRDLSANGGIPSMCGTQMLPLILGGE